jgi:hypothetical protein
MSELLQKVLATVMHDECCGWDHTDQCAWLYENDREKPWEERKHAEWLARAGRILTANPNTTLTDVLEVMAAQSLVSTRIGKWSRTQ